MNSNVEILVYGTSGSTAVGILDLFDSEPITLSIAVSDIKDIKTRKSTFSQSFTVPGTRNNNTLFNFLFEIGSDSQFDPRKKTPCQLLVDTIPVMTNGNLQLTAINVDDQKSITYEVSVFDEVEDLIDAIGDRELTDLSFSGLNHTWSYSSITASWTGSSQPYFYPMMDYGYDLNITQLNNGTGMTVNQFYPATQVKTIVDKIFSGAGFTYSSTLFDSTYFKNLYIPFNGTTNFNNTQAWAKRQQFNVQPKLNVSFSGTVNPQSNANLSITYDSIGQFNNTTVFPAFDNGSLFNPSTFKYTADTLSIQSFKVQLDWMLSASTGNLGSTYGIIRGARFFRSGYMNGTQPFQSVLNTTVPHVSRNVQYIEAYESAPCDNPNSGNPFYYIQPGEAVWANLVVEAADLTGIGTAYTATINIYLSGTFFSNSVSTQAIPNQVLNYDLLIPSKIKQIEFLNSIINMHNLYVVSDVNNSKHLTILPRDQYYSGGTTKDWSKLLDESQKVNEVVLSEQTNKRFIFSYKNDSDYYNNDYSTVTNKIFGDYYYIIDNDFVKDDKNIYLIFSPTPSIPVLESNLFVPVGITTQVVNDFVIPKIGKVDSNDQFGATNFNIRILQKNSGNLLPLSTDTWQFEGNIYNQFPYLGMLNHPFSGDTDISFGTVNYEYYTLPDITDNNLINNYWKTYLDQIADKNSKLITAYFKLSPADIQNFKFSDSIFVDGLTSDGGHYFIVNKIEYTLTSNMPSKVELIKVNDKTVIKGRSAVPYIPYTRPRQVINLAGGLSLSTGSVAIGDSVTISQMSSGSLAIGDNILIDGGSRDSFAMGSSLRIGGGSQNSFIMGNNSAISANTINSFVLGNNMTGTSSNTLYTNNIVLSSSSTLTIGNTVISSTGTTTDPWKSGSTGTFSIRANNNTAIDAIGNYAVAEGNNTTASGFTSHAEGSNSTSQGNYSHAEGLGSLSLGTASHAEGSTNANGDFSHAEGNASVSNGASSHAEGSSSANADYSHSENFGTANGLYSHAENSSITYGDNSHGEGTGTASGQTSHAEGYNTLALGTASHAEGGDPNFVFATPTTAIGAASHAEGFQTTAIGTYSHSEGDSTTASGFTAHAEGFSTSALNDYTHSEGYLTIAGGLYSHAEGNGSIASGLISHAEGGGSTAIGTNSHAEGGNSIASGIQSHSEGSQTTALGVSSHSEGDNTTAKGDKSHAGGHSSIASGDTSFVHGNNSIAIGSSTIVLGDNITGATNNTLYSSNLNVASKTVLSTVTATTISAITVTASTRLDVGLTAFNTINTERLLVDDGVAATAYSNTIVAKANTNNYAQFNITNSNSGTSASSDIVATANNGNENINFIDMGINSSGYTDIVGIANDAYVYSTGNNLYIGNATASKNIQFFTDGTNSANTRVTVTSASTRFDVPILSGATDLMTYINTTMSRYTTLVFGGILLGTATAAGTFLITGQLNTAVKSNTTAAGGVGIAYINIVAADYPAINGLNPKLRIRASLSTNNIAPTGGYTFGLYPVRVTGGTATNITFSAGTVVSGSQTTSIIAPASGTTTNVVGSDFALPTDGLYVIGLVTTATTAANSVTSTVSYLQMRYN